MVQLFCPEQIGIPLNFPDILKNYAKSAIRTQPYDLLRWSAEYFRSLANNVSPMVKCRLEKQTHHGQLTKGYLRVLISQVGRGFFINRIILENKWRGLCLPQDELLKYLSLCRMLKWSQVHWLKLLAVMVGSINDNLTDSIVMLCELLSDDVDGGLARIPIWMFTVIYKYLAYLDCSEEQKFMDGRKVLENGELEPETLIEELPYILSTSSIKKAITQQLGEANNDNLNQNLEKNSSQETIQTKDFRFYNNEESTFTFLKKFDKFNSFIFYIQENQNLPKLEDFPGPYNISPQAIQKARVNEEQIIAKRERNNLMFSDNINKYVYQDQVNMLKELGPPWSWIYQFTADNCVDKSYNLVEEQSVLSDITPELSSDESFNFLTQKPLEQEDDGSISSSVATINTIEEAKFVADVLLAKDPPNLSTLNQIEEYLRFAEEKGDVNIENTSSIYSILCKEEQKILENASEKICPNNVDMKIVLTIIKNADDNDITFKKIDDVMEYLNDGYNDVQAKFMKYEEPLEESSVLLSSDIVMTEPEPEPTPSEVEQLLVNYGAGTLNEQPPEVRKCMKLKDNAEGDTKQDEIPEMKLDPIEKGFENAGITIDAGLLGAKIPDEMILGLVDGPRKPESSESTAPSSTIDCSGSCSRLGYRSDDSSIFITTDTVDNKKVFKTCPFSDSDEPSATHLLSFKCNLPVFPGIGPIVNDKTVKEFLKYIKYRAMLQKGLVMPLNFKEDKCPVLVDDVEICQK